MIVNIKSKKLKLYIVLTFNIYKIVWAIYITYFYKIIIKVFVKFFWIYFYKIITIFILYNNFKFWLLIY